MQRLIKRQFANTAKKVETAVNSEQINHAVVSVFDLFSIGIGPSSSHTVGPMRAALAFVESVQEIGLNHTFIFRFTIHSLKGVMSKVAKIRVDLYGSLALTGEGHGTPKAILMGLEGESPEHVDTRLIDSRMNKIQSNSQITLLSTHRIPFSFHKDVVFHMNESLPFHPNGMRMSVFDSNGTILATNDYFSVGGGFVVNDETKHSENIFYKKEEGNLTVSRKTQAAVIAALPFTNATDLLRVCKEKKMSISDVVWYNELKWRNESQIAESTMKIWKTMEASIRNGVLSDQEVLPGTLKVKRRAPGLFKKLVQECGFVPSNVVMNTAVLEELQSKKIAEATTMDYNKLHSTISSVTSVAPLIERGKILYPLDWLSLFAIAVNEENAAGGRVVTAPTNGASGIIPSVLKYYVEFIAQQQVEADVIKFLHTAAAIGMLYKRGASISAAEVGCQGEVGVACSMAAGALAAVMGGTPSQVENAAEIAMEHNLGLTCDPISGLVQIPCIERNALGAVKAVAAAQLALHGNGEHKVSLDQVIETMRQTGADMQSKYKETSLGGLAVNVPLC